MKQNFAMKISIGLLVAVVTFGATKAAMRSKAEKAEMQEAQAAAAAAERNARQAESEHR
jgi:hypothetical protein